MSTFHGLEMAKQALFAQQSALYTTGHNISNANREGYSRQRVNFETMPAYPTPARNRPELPGQIGTGVGVGSVQRIRDDFLDKQFRAENSRSGYWNTKADALSRMEELLNEPSNSGLSKTMDQFWESLQDLAVEPASSGARSVVTQRGIAVAETFQYLSSTLGSIRTDLENQIDVTEKNVNSLLNQINEINDQIKQIEPHGHLSNDLYDERDRLIDDLSNIVTINVTYTASGGNPLKIAQGIATIELVDDLGNPLGGDDPILLVDGANGVYNEIDIQYTENSDPYQVVEGFTIGDSGVTLDISTLMESSGSFKGLIEAYGYGDQANYSGEFPKVMDELDQMAVNFAEAFNEAHKAGYDLNGNAGVNFFEMEGTKGAASLITVNEAILKDEDLIAASNEQIEGSGSEDNEGLSGDGGNALDLAETIRGEKVSGAFQSLIGEIGVQAQEANRMASNTQVLRSQVEERRMSVSAVSLDEEMTNMIKFQHAYNAAARSMTTMDEMLDRIINNMGLVGR